MKVRSRERSQKAGESTPLNGALVTKFGGKRRRLTRRQGTTVTLTFVVVLLAIAIGTLLNSSVFAISNVKVTIHGKLITDSEVLTYTEAIKGLNYFNVDVEKIANNFNSDPNIESATVTKSFPNTVSITLESAKPSYVVMTNFATLSRISLNLRGQPINGVSPPSNLPIICSSRVATFTDSASDFDCGPTTKVADVQSILSRISTILNSWPEAKAKILSIYIFNGYGIGVQDGSGDLIYFANENSTPLSLDVLSRLLTSTSFPHPFLLDLSNLRSPFYLPVPALKGK
ncbi:MAG: FtsQ-type POTRA domain-containing protein [Actinomycetota bacterium]|nr:FtsQ-type POTRA domain-containing protein [Actinomycetota bacterium]